MMRVQTKELVQPETLGEVAPLIPDCIELERTSSDGNFVMRLDRSPFAPEDVYAILKSIAPDPDGDFPQGILADWEEPDRVTQEARDRIARHEALPGWSEFLKARHLFMHVMRRVPERKGGEGMVSPITEPHETARFAGALLIKNFHGDLAFTKNALDELKLDDDERAEFDRIIAQNILADDSLNSYPTHDAFAAYLEEKPEITAAIMQQLVSALQGQSSDWPSEFFASRYAARLSQTRRGGQPTVEPFAKVTGGYPTRGGVWRIEGAFGRRKEGRRTFLAADLLDEQNKVFTAILDGTLKSRGRMPRIRPEIRWHSADDGTRDFELYEQGPSRLRKIASSGVFGVMLAAGLQPEVTHGWPKELGQRMGMAQVPVLALGRRQELLPLLARAEELII